MRVSKYTGEGKLTAQLGGKEMGTKGRKNVKKPKKPKEKKK